MAVIGNTNLTLFDNAKRTDPKGKTPVIAELLTQSNEMLMDMVSKEGNLPTGEQVTIRTGLPTAYYRMTNNGTPKSKSTTAQITEQSSILEARSELDVDIATLNGNTNEFRATESMAFLEAMNQRQQLTTIYGSSSSPEEFVGLANRYSSTTDGNGANVMLAGGAGADNTSIFLTAWGDNYLYGVYPKGSKAGLSHEDLGVGDAFDADNNRFRAYMDIYKWKMGLVVKDWRYAVRIANIDVSDLSTQTNSQALTASTSIIKLMAIALSKIPTRTNVKLSFNVSRTVASYLQIIAMDKSSSAVKIEEATTQFGTTIQELRFLGVPVRLVDQITNAETLVS